jgi:hypothetical protein
MADDKIFVFGSNKIGVHGAGAAKHAKQFYGAVYGCGEGLRGQSYAIPTKKTPYVSMPLDEVAQGVRRFVAFTQQHPEMQFVLTRVGCGMAGFTDEQMAPLFEGLPDNVELPERWVGLVGANPGT